MRDRVKENDYISRGHWSSRIGQLNIGLLNENEYIHTIFQKLRIWCQFANF